MQVSTSYQACIAIVCPFQTDWLMSMQSTERLQAMQVQDILTPNSTEVRMGKQCR